MKQKLLVTLLALVAIATTARAQIDYGFYVGGVRVNSSNASNITGSDITSGTVTYNHSNKTLTLNGVTISRTGSGTNGIDNESCTGLKIVFQGTNNLTNSGGAAVLKFQVGTTIECAANSVTNLTQNSSNDEGIYFFGGTLTFEGSGTLNITSNCHGIEGKDATRNVVFGGPEVSIKSKNACLRDIGSITFRYGSYVTLDYIYVSGTTTPKRVDNVKNMTFENDQSIYYPDSFDASQKTIVNSRGTPITNERIVIRGPGYEVRASADPTAGGDVAITGQDYTGGTWGTERYFYYGSTATVKATPKTGYRFVKWTESGSQVSTNATYSFTVTGRRTLTAVFEPLSYTVSVSANPTAGGTVTGAGTYQYNTQVTLQATANAGYRFDKWTKKNTSTGAFEDAPNIYWGSYTSYTCTSNPYKFDMGAANATYRAEFVKTYTVTATSTLEGATVSGGGTYDTGAQVTLSVSNIPTGYRFKCWTVDGTSVSTNPTYTFTCTANREVKAVFECDITASAYPEHCGTVSGTALGTYTTGGNIGRRVSLTATPSSDRYWFVRWKENGEQVSTSNPYNFAVFSTPHSFVAEFGLNLLNDDQSNQNQSELATNNDEKRSVILKNRSLLKGQWNVVCLPFNLDNFEGTPFEGTPFEGATVKTLTSSSYDGGTKTLTIDFLTVMGMQAGWPYLVYLPGEGTLDDPAFYDVTINNATPFCIDSYYADFVGTYSPYSLTEDDGTVLYMANDSKIYHPNGEMKINAFRAYFQLKNESVDAENIVLNYGDGWTESYSIGSAGSNKKVAWTVTQINDVTEAELMVARKDANETMTCAKPFTTQTIAPENLTKATLRVAERKASEYGVYLVSYVENKILLIKAVKEIVGLTLTEAKALVDSADGTAPVLIKTFATAEEAQAAKQTLEDLNATVTMEEVVTYATSNQSFKVYRNGVDVTAQGTADGNYLCFEVSPDNLANTTWVITAEPVMPNPYDVNGDGVINPQDALKVIEKYMDQ